MVTKLKELLDVAGELFPPGENGFPIPGISMGRDKAAGIPVLNVPCCNSAGETKFIYITLDEFDWHDIRAELMKAKAEIAKILT